MKNNLNISFPWCGCSKVGCETTGRQLKPSSWQN